MRALTGTVAIALLLILAAQGVAPAAPSVGLGVMAGEPTGVSLKVWGSSRHAIDGAAGWSIGEGGWLYLHGDYLWHRYELDPEEFEGRVPYYFGVGCRVLLHEGEESRLGVRFPIGLDYLFDGERFDVFIEVAPVLDLVPETDFDLSGGVGARYYF
jgi:hypothetical protein